MIADPGIIEYKSYLLFVMKNTFSGLSSSRGKEEKTRIVDELFRRYEAEVEKHPDSYQDEWSFAYIQIQKRSDF